MLPELDGLELCARIRQKPGTKDPYILMLTARGEEIDRIIGLSTGADDYMVKPFSPRELTARVRALLRRSLRHDSQPQQLHRSRHFIIDLDRYPNRVWSRTQLIDNLWGNDFFGDERVVDTHIRRLRKKVEPDPANPIFIKTVVGVGYKFEDDDLYQNCSRCRL